jgi:hypothetical protein
MKRLVNRNFRSAHGFYSNRPPKRFAVSASYSPVSFTSDDVVELLWKAPELQGYPSQLIEVDGLLQIKIGDHIYDLIPIEEYY